MAEDAINKSRGQKKDISMKSVDLHNAYVSPASKDKRVKNYMQKIGTSGVKVTITSPSRAIQQQPQPQFHDNKPGSISGSESGIYTGNHAAMPMTNKAAMPNDNTPVMLTSNKLVTPTKNKPVMPTNNKLAIPTRNKPVTPTNNKPAIPTIITPSASTSKMQDIPDNDSQGKNEKDKSRSKDKKKEDKKSSSAAMDETNSEADKCDPLDETNKPPLDMKPIPDEAFEIIYKGTCNVILIITE